MPELSICIPVWKDLDLLERCLRSIDSGTEGVEYEIIIPYTEVDGLELNSLPSVVEMELRGVPIDAFEVESKGHNWAVDRGLERAGGNFIMFIDDDIVVSKGWWDRRWGIREIFNSDERIGIVSPVSYPRWDQFVLTIHALPDALNTLEKLNSKEIIEIVNSRNPPWFDLPIRIDEGECMRLYGWSCSDLARWDFAFEGHMIMRRKCYKENGGYAENPCGGQEVNISRNARERGWRVVCASRIHFWHYHGPVMNRADYYGRSYSRRGGRHEEI